MKIGERGQVTIPRKLRERFGLAPQAEVEFVVIEGALLLRKKSAEVDFAKWKGRCSDSLRRLRMASADDFIEQVRGR